MRTFLIFPLLLLFLASCSTMKPQSFANGTPKLEPLSFFEGVTKSYGVREARSGKPSIRTTTETKGVFKEGVLHLEQDLFTEDGKKNHRSWQLRQVDATHFDATADDITGTAHGLLYGNYFTWSYQLKVADHGLVKRVKMTQYMYLLPDGKTLVIRSVLRKFGFIVQEITEGFRKE